MDSRGHRDRGSREKRMMVHTHGLHITIKNGRIEENKSERKVSEERGRKGETQEKRVGEFSARLCTHIL